MVLPVMLNFINESFLSFSFKKKNLLRRIIAFYIKNGNKIQSLKRNFTKKSCIKKLLFLS